MAAPTFTPFTEEFHTGGFIVSQANGNMSFAAGVLATTWKLAAGFVLGQITIGAVTSAAKGGGNTGNGTWVQDATAPAQARAKVGIYTLVCVIAATNGGTFDLVDSNGISIGQYAIAGGAGGTVIVNDQIKGVLTDGSTDFVVGDAFLITVAAGSGQFAPYDPTAFNGTQNAIGILYQDADATNAAQNIAIFQRAGEFNISELLWGTNVTTQAQKNAAYANFALVNLIGR
jgi:hypothetical protein